MPDWIHYCQQAPWSHHDITLLPCSFFKHCLDWTICVSGAEHLPCMCWGLGLIHSIATGKTNTYDIQTSSALQSNFLSIVTVKSLAPWMSWQMIGLHWGQGGNGDMHNCMLPHSQSLRVVGSTSVWVISMKNWHWHLGGNGLDCPHRPASVDLFLPALRCGANSCFIKKVLTFFWNTE